MSKLQTALKIDTGKLSMLSPNMVLVVAFPVPFAIHGRQDGSPTNSDTDSDRLTVTLVVQDKLTLRGIHHLGTGRVGWTGDFHISWQHV